MINWAVRYAPIFKLLRPHPHERVLEVGSGPEGLGMFWDGRVTGMDVRFKRRPIHQAVQASGLALPCKNGGFPIVVSCDFLEHLPPWERGKAVDELGRVAGSRILLGFPSGKHAAALYARLADTFGHPIPDWLEDHQRFGLPEAAVVAGQLQEQGWKVEVMWYEGVHLHGRLVLLEQKYGMKWLTYPLMRLWGRRLVSRVPYRTAPPFLRVLLDAKKI